MDSSVKNISDITFNAMQILSRNMAKSYSWNEIRNTGKFYLIKFDGFEVAHRVVWK